MSVFKLKIPSPVLNAEIIRAKKADFRKTNIFKPFDDDELEDLNNESHSNDNKNGITKFYEETYLKSSSEPIQIDISKIEAAKFSLSNVQDEIQHAYDQGFDEAQQLTRTTFEIELQKRQHWVLNFDSLFNEMRTHFSHELAKLEKAVIPLAVQIAEHILKNEASLDDSIIISQAKNALKSIDDEEILKIYVHPYNYDILKQAQSTLVSDENLIKNLAVIPDNNIDQGSCFIQTSAGNIDATFSAQLEKIRKILLNSPVVAAENIIEQTDISE